MEWIGGRIATQSMEEAFEEVYNRYYLSVYLYLFKRIRHQQDAEDLANDVFLACYKNFGSYDPAKASMITWIFVIASNRLKNYYRDRREFFYLDDRAHASELPAGEPLEQAVLLEEGRAAVRDAIDALPERQREIVLLRYFRGLNSNEIGERIGASPGNVRVLLNRALGRLRAYLESRHFEMEL